MEYQVILSYLKQLQVSKFKECDYSLYLNYGTIGKLFYQDKVFIVILKKDSVCDYIFLEYYMKDVKNLEDILDSIRERIIAKKAIGEIEENQMFQGFNIYEIYNGKSGGAYRASRYLAEAIKSKPSKCLYSSLNEGIQFEPSPDKKGGIIVFSTDVNAEKQSDNKIINWLKQKMMTIGNRLNATKKIDKIAADNEPVGWAIGHYLDGRYTSPKNGKQYGENSLSVEIIGVDFEQLMKISMELCAAFRQESVLLKDFSSGRVLFVDRS